MSVVILGIVTIILAELFTIVIHMGIPERHVVEIIACFRIGLAAVVDVVVEEAGIFETDRVGGVVGAGLRFVSLLGVPPGWEGGGAGGGV